jgi:hypothetical protein
MQIACSFPIYGYFADELCEEWRNIPEVLDNLMWSGARVDKARAGRWEGFIKKHKELLRSVAFGARPGVARDALWSLHKVRLGHKIFPRITSLVDESVSYHGFVNDVSQIIVEVGDDLQVPF